MKKTDPMEGKLKVLHAATCPSLSGKSELTYQIGGDGTSKVYLRVQSNTGGGFFSPEWVSLESIQKAIDAAPKDRPLSALTLQPLFRGRSVNTPAFLMAALVHEKWLRILKGKKRGLEILDPGPFRAKVKKLAGSTPAKSPAKKAPVRRKKPSPAKKKTA